MTKDTLGNRMKLYEEQETFARFLPNTPIMARIDGRCFSKLTKGMKRPFDEDFSLVMRAVTAFLVEETGASIGYTQSDEINLAWYNSNPNSEIFFGGRKFKMTAQLAALATACFHIEAREKFDVLLRKYIPTFDARVFQVPTLDEAVNVFLWRQLDCRKNAVSMAARTKYSHRELLNKNTDQMIEMLGEKGVDFYSYPWQFRSGVFLRREVIRREITEDERNEIPEDYRPDPGEEICRSLTREYDIPILSKVENSKDFLFFGANEIQLKTYQSIGN